MNEAPMISCICVTDNRPKFLIRIINCFVNQTYTNKELLISYPTGDVATIDVVNYVKEVDPNFNLLTIERNAGESVGNARNTAIAKCSGLYTCVWDDDDWYHPARLESQITSMLASKHSACVLRSIILFNAITNQAYQSFLYPWENTLLCRKEVIMQNPYANANKGEDTHIITFLNNKQFLHHIDDEPFLYVYIFHGKNTWDLKHYNYLVDRSLLLDNDITKDLAEAIS